MKKVCLVKWIVDGVDGGLKVAINLSNELSEDFEMHFVSMTQTVDKPFFEMLPDVKYHNFLRGKYKLSKNLLKFSRMLREYLIKHDIDIVMSIGISANTLILAATLGLKTKTIVCEHLNSKKGVFTTSNKIQRYLGAKFANHVVVLTKEDRENYIKKYSIKESNISYIYNWINLNEDIKFSDLTIKKIVTVGRLSDQKGYDLLIKVASQILPKYPEWKWDIYGSGEHSVTQYYLKLIKEHNLEKQLRLCSLQRDLNKIYGNCSLYVMTSYYEGLPLVLLEAKQYKLPIISFKCPTGPADIIRDNINGYLIEPYNIEKMSMKIEGLLSDLEKRKQFSEAAYLDIERFDKSSIIEKWKFLINNL